MWPGVIALQLEVLVFEVEDALHVRIDLHRGQLTRLTCQLQTGLIEVVQIEVGVASGVDKLTRLQSANLSHHHAEQRIRCDVEGHTQEGVGRALIELQRQLSVSHIELEDGVTRGQCHLVDLCHIPC